MKRSTERGIKTMVWLGVVVGGVYFGVKYALPAVLQALDMQTFESSALTSNKASELWNTYKPSNITGHQASDAYLARIFADLKDIPTGFFTWAAYMQGEGSQGGSGGMPVDHDKSGALHITM